MNSMIKKNVMNVKSIIIIYQLLVESTLSIVTHIAISPMRVACCLYKHLPHEYEYVYSRHLERSYTFYCLNNLYELSRFTILVSTYRFSCISYSKFT